MNQQQLLLLFIFGAVIAIFCKQLIRLAIFRKITFSMILASVVLISIISLGSLPVELMPNIAYGNITIYTDVRGGMPSSDVERLVTKPIEEAMSTVTHLKNIISSSKRNKSVVTLEFESGTNMNMAALDVRECFLQIKEKLPKEIEKPIIARYEEADAPIYIIALTSNRKTPEDLRRIVEENFKDKLMRCEGVANVEISGGRARKVIANIDENRLSAYTLSMNDVVYAIDQNNINMLVGQMKAKHVAYGLRTLGAFNSVEEIANIGVRTDKGTSIIRLKDIADVKDSYMEAETYSRLNSKEAVTVYIQKESSANTIKAVGGIKEVIEKLKKNLDEDIDMVVISDQAERILESIHSIQMTMFFGIMLVIVVLSVVLTKHLFTKGLSLIILVLYFAMLFSCYFLDLPILYMKYFIVASILMFFILGLWYIDYRPALFIAITVPISLLITISLMYIGKVSINIMSLSGLVLGVGLLVDNSIVVVENYLVKREQNPGLPYETVIQTSTMEMVESLIGSTLTTVVVFLSFSFLEKRMQLLYADIAFSVTASLFSSLFCALGVIPMLMSYYESGNFERGREFIHKIQFYVERLIKGTQYLILCRIKYCVPLIKKLRPLLSFVVVSSLCYGLFLLFYKKIYTVDKLAFVLAVAIVFSIGVYGFFSYKDILRKAFSNKIVVLAVVIGLCGAAFYQFIYRMPKDFVSSSERSQFIVFVELASGVKLDIANKIAKGAEKIIKDTDEISDMIKSMSTKTEGWSTKIYVTLVPRKERKYSTSKVISILRERLKEVGKDYDGFVYFSEPQEGKELFIDLYGYDYDVLVELAMQLSSKISKIEGLTDVKIRYKPGRPEVSIDVMQHRIELFGLMVKDIAEDMHAKMRGLRATEFRTNQEEVETVVRLRPEQIERLDQMRASYIIGHVANKDFLFPLEHIADFTFGLAPSEIWHRNKTRMIQVSASIGKMPLEQAANSTLFVIKKMEFPKGYYADIGGDYDELVNSQKAFRKAIVVTVFLVFAVMACIFESPLQPFVIMFTVLISVFGAVAALIISKSVVSSGVLIGLLMLGGIVVNNGIILISCINRLQKDNTDGKKSLFEIIYEASKKRMRPVLMTTCTTVCGLVPMVLDTSESSVMWRPFAITVIGGLVVSTVLTLFIVPMMYYVITNLKNIKNILKNPILIIYDKRWVKK